MPLLALPANQGNPVPLLSLISEDYSALHLGERGGSGTVVVRSKHPVQAFAWQPQSILHIGYINEYSTGGCATVLDMLFSGQRKSNVAVITGGAWAWHDQPPHIEIMTQHHSFTEHGRRRHVTHTILSTALDKSSITPLMVPCLPLLMSSPNMHVDDLLWIVHI